MPEIVKTIKIHLRPSKDEKEAFRMLTERYAAACTYVSDYVFNHGFILNSNELQKLLYQTVRKEFGLKSQLTISVFKTVTARYKTVQQQLENNPYRYKVTKNGNESWGYIQRTLEWLWKPIYFRGRRQT